MITLKTKCVIVNSLKFAIISGILSTNVHGSISTSKALDIAIIGAGPAGLTSAKNALEQRHNIDIFEKQAALGGTWYYTDNTGTDEYGIRHTAMYQGVRFVCVETTFT